MTVRSARSRPSGRGLPSGGISQSSGTRVASAVKAAGTTATVPRLASMVATKWRWPPPSMVATSGCGWRERAEIDQRGEAGGGERAGRKAQPAPECEALPQPGARAALRGQGTGDAIPHLRRRRISAISAAQGASRCSQAATWRAKPRSRAMRCSAVARSAPSSTPSAYSAASSSSSGRAAMVECVAHCSRHAFSLIMARRIQLFMVPSGTFMRVGQILIGVAVEECAAQRRALVRRKAVEAAVQACVLLARFPARCRRAAGVGNLGSGFDRRPCCGSCAMRAAGRSSGCARWRSARSSGLPGWHRNRRPCATPSRRPPAARPPLRRAHPRYEGRRQKASPRSGDRPFAVPPGRRPESGRARRQSGCGWRRDPSDAGPILAGSRRTLRLCRVPATITTAGCRMISRQGAGKRGVRQGQGAADRRV